GTAFHRALDQVRLQVPAVDHHFRAAVADEVLQVEAVALDLTEGVVEDDVDVGEDGQRRLRLDHVDAFIGEKRGDPGADHRAVIVHGYPHHGITGCSVGSHPAPICSGVKGGNRTPPRPDPS